jgi:hypothetical protein
LALLERDRRGRRFTVGQGFKVKIDGECWQDYKPEVNTLLTEAYKNGVPSVRFRAQGEMYKFDFEANELRNLSAVISFPMRPPAGVDRPNSPRSRTSTRERLCSALVAPISVAHDSYRGRDVRPVYAVRVPEGAVGRVINVPHPKKLGKAMRVTVPSEAKVGELFFVPVPRTKMKTSAKVVVGTTVGAGVGAVAVAIGDSAAAGAAGGAGALGLGGAAIAGAAPVLLGGLAVAGAVAVGVAGVRYATKNPRKVAAIGALSIGALLLADHVAEVGFVEAAGDVAEGIGDVAEGAADAIEWGTDVGEEMFDAAVDAGDWIEGAADDAFDVILDLF